MPHIPLDSLELYALGRLPERELADVEEHIVCCPECVTVLNDLEGFTRTISTALQATNSELVAEHHTAEGPIRLYVRCLSPEHVQWLGRVRGDKVDAGVHAPSRDQALVAVENLFRQMYPEHGCMRDCIVQNRLQLSG